MRHFYSVLVALHLLVLTSGAGAVARDAALVEPEWVAARLLDSGRGIGLRWNTVAGAGGYEIHRRVGAGDFRLLATVQGIQFVDQGVEAGGEYGYRLRGLGEAGPGAFSEVRTVRLPPAAAEPELFAPRWRKSAVEMTEWSGRPPTWRVVLSWRPVAGAVGYRLSRSTVGGPGFETLLTSAGAAAVDEAVEAGRAYVYVLTAFDARLEESPRSLELPVAVGPEYATVLAGDEPTFPALLLWETGNATPQSPAVAGRAQLTDPVDVAFDRARDRVYVSSAHHRHVVMLRGADGLPTGVIGPRLGKHELRLPVGVGLSAGGDLVVVDQEPATLYVVAPDGRLRRRIPVAAAKGAKPPRLVDAAFHRDGRIFATDAANGRILVLGADGRRLAAWGKPGARAEEFGAVGAIEVEADGTVAVADVDAGQIKLFTPKGKFLRAIGARAGGEAGFAFLGGFGAEGEGRFLAADLAENRVKRIGPGSDKAAPLPIGTASGEFGLFGPLAVAGDGAGRAFIVEGIANRVVGVRLSPAVAPR